MVALKKNPEDLNYLLATDVGSTTTKARFFKNVSGEYRYVASGESPTTVEAPYEDVTMGVRNCVREVEELTGHKLLDESGEGIITPGEEGRGVDLYVSTSSAGGGLQMLVCGLIRTMTAESAERAALGAGSIIMDVIALDDGRMDHQKIQRIRNLRPDMILLAGGTDGGNKRDLLEMVDLVKASEPKARLGADYLLPIVFAGNKDCKNEVTDKLGCFCALQCVDNLRPKLETEIIEPSRMAIHELFMEHVMSHAPGYDKLMKWTEVPIMPTPAAEGLMIQLIGRTLKANTIGVGLGGATTNVYSVVDGKFVRTVSANLGMSYSICNVMKEAGIGNIAKWLPFDIEEADLRNRLRNKMIRPTTIPQTVEELIVEHAVAREALQLGLKHHKSLARELKGGKKGPTGPFSELEEETYIDMLNIKIVAGTGGLLSHAPRRVQSMLILTDGFQVEGVTRLFQDSVFMMPHLGVLSTVHEHAAWEIFNKDCLIRLGTLIAPRGSCKPGEEALSVTLKMPEGETIDETLAMGEVKRIPLEDGKEAQAIIQPRHELDVGEGPGHRLQTTVAGGVVGLILDARGRPLVLPEENNERKAKLIEWFNALSLYPENFLEKFQKDLKK